MSASWAWTLDYVVRDQRDTNDDSHFVRLQGDYNISKRTSLFGNLVALSNEGAARQRFYGAGGAGLSQNLVSLGIRHTF